MILAILSAVNVAIKYLNIPHKSPFVKGKVIHRLLTPAARGILTPTPEARVITHRLGVTVIKPHTQGGMVVVSHLAIWVAHH